MPMVNGKKFAYTNKGKAAAKAAKAANKKEYSRTWRPATPGSEGPKKKVAKKPVMRKK